MVWYSISEQRTSGDISSNINLIEKVQPWTRSRRKECLWSIFRIAYTDLPQLGTWPEGFCAKYSPLGTSSSLHFPDSINSYHLQVWCTIYFKWKTSSLAVESHWEIFGIMALVSSLLPCGTLLAHAECSDQELNCSRTSITAFNSAHLSPSFRLSGWRPVY